VAGLKYVMAVQETELASAGVAQEMAKQGRQHLEAECQKLRSTCSSKSPSILHHVFFYRCVSRLRMRALSDQEEKVTVN
jgi:hypothetical protein